MTDHLTVLPNGGGFWQINFGHILTIVSIFATLCIMYGRLSNTLESHTEKIAILEVGENRMEGEIAAQAVSGAAANQDRIDLHKTIEDDFSRRLTKLEDRMDTGTK
jgi:hypothetical protein